MISHAHPARTRTRARAVGLALVAAGLVGLVAGCGSSVDLGDEAVASAAGPLARTEAPGAKPSPVVAADVALPIPARPTVDVPDSWPSEIDELFGRYRLYWEAFAAAHGPPVADPAHAVLRDLSTEVNWDSLAPQLEGFAADGLILQRPASSRSEHRLRLPGTVVLDRVEGAEAVLQDCWIDDFEQWTVDGRLVEQRNEVKLMNVVMRVDEGEWRVDGVAFAGPTSDGHQHCRAVARELDLSYRMED